MQVLATLLVAIAVLLLFTLALGLFGLIGLELHWGVSGLERAWL